MPRVLRTTSVNSTQDTSKVYGRLRVRSLSASQLNTSDLQVFTPWAAVDPFAVLALKDTQGGGLSLRRFTRPVRNTLNPEWREEFWFPVYEKVEGLVLHVEVFNDSGKGREAELLGHADLDVNLEHLQKENHKWQVQEVQLRPRVSLLQASTSGVVRLEVSWEPSLVPKDAATAKAAADVVLRSPQALRVVGVAQLAFSCPLCIVAARARWLCEGTSIHSCHDVMVPGAGACCVLAAILTCIAGSTHFLGSAGLCGFGWRERPIPSLLDLTEDEEFQEDFSRGLRLQVQSTGVLKWDIALASTLCPRVSMPAFRVAAWMAHVAALLLVSLALLFAWVEDGGPSEGIFVGEAVYVALWAVACMVGSVFVFWQEQRLRTDASLTRPGHHAPPRMASDISDSQMQVRAQGGGTGGCEGGGEGAPRPGPALGLENWALRAGHSLHALALQAEHLAQPLLEAQQRFAVRLEGPQPQEPENPRGLSQAAVPLVPERHGADHSPEWSNTHSLHLGGYNGSSSQNLRRQPTSRSLPSSLQPQNTRSEGYIPYTETGHDAVMEGAEETTQRAGSCLSCGWGI